MMPQATDMGRWGTKTGECPQLEPCTTELQWAQATPRIRLVFLEKADDSEGTEMLLGLFEGKRSSFAVEMELRRYRRQGLRAISDHK